MTTKGPEFLKRRFNLHAAPEVDKAARRTIVRTDEKVSQRPAERIQNYLDRFTEIVDSSDKDKRRFGLRALKKILHDEFVIKSEEIPESYFRLQQQIAREQGHGTIEITDEMREEAVKVIQEDQSASLNEWVDYLASGDALYPDWAKYWVFRSLVGMSLYDKENMHFGTRSKHTTAPYPDLNREALAYVVDLIQKKIRGEKAENPVKEGDNDFAEEGKLVTDEEFEHMLSTENFARYYAFAIEHVVADNSKQLETIDGEWRIFKQGSNPIELTKTLQGHGTGWCTAGEATAAASLEEGDFYVYFSKNALGVANIPRLAIRMEGDDIAEVRGVAHQQEIDPYIGTVLETKLDEFGKEGEEYKKKAQQMRLLTAIDRKVSASEPLTREDLTFLYEIEGKIRGFGYSRDPRINEILEKRDARADITLLLDAKDDNDFLIKFLKSNFQVICRFLQVKVEDEGEEEEHQEIDMEDYDNKIVAFLEENLPKMKGLKLDAAKAIEDAGYFRVILTAKNSFDFGEKFALLQLVREHDDANGDNLFEELIEDFFKDAPQSELIEFVEMQIRKGDFTDFDDILLEARNIPVRIAVQLIEADQENVLAEHLKNFASGLTSEVAMELIKAGRADAVVNHLQLFGMLNLQVRAALIEDGYEDEVMSNPKSFDEQLKRNPFGQLIREDPFKK